MDNQHLRAIILKLQDRLSDNDRRRLHFFLGNDVPRRIRDDPTLGGTLCLMESLFDQDKINEEDFSFLINTFEEIQCFDAAKLLREHMKQRQTTKSDPSIPSLARLMSHTNNIDQILEDQEDDRIAIPSVSIDEKNDFATYNKMIEQKNGYDNSIMMKKDNTELNSHSVNVDNRTSIKQNDISKKSSITKKYLLIFVALILILTIVLIGLIIGLILVRSKMKRNESNCLQEQMKNNETIQYLKELQLKNTEITSNLTSKTKHLENELKITIGTTCGCSKWCTDRGSKYGVCGDGLTCICRQFLITKENVGDLCTCDTWCQKYGHKNGGICGDGHTCICSS